MTFPLSRFSTVAASGLFAIVLGTVATWNSAVSAQQQPAAAKPAQAQTQQQKPAVTAEPAKVFGKWSLRCVQAKEARVCQLNQVFVQSDTKKEVMRVSVIHKKDTNTDSFVIAAPLGADLAKNASFQVPGVTLAPQPYQFCMRDGCYAEIQLTPALLATMKKGGQGTITFSIFRAANPVSLNVSFEGFSDGYTALMAQ